MGDPQSQCETVQQRSSRSAGAKPPPPPPVPVWAGGRKVLAHIQGRRGQVRPLSNPGSLGQPWALAVGSFHLGTEEESFSAAAAEPGTEGMAAASVSAVSQTSHFFHRVASGLISFGSSPLSEPGFPSLKSFCELILLP